MEENKIYSIIGYFAIALILLSVMNIGLRLTGNVTNTGTVNLTIEPVLQINFTTFNVDFGSGAVNSGLSNATIDTLGNVINGNWTPTVGGFIIENKGNQDVMLQLKTMKTALQLLGGNNPQYMYRIIDKDLENGSCSSGINLGEWYNVNVTGDGTLICGNFSSSDSIDEINIDIKLVIPSDSKNGVQTDNLIATATII